MLKHTRLEEKRRAHKEKAEAKAKARKRPYIAKLQWAETLVNEDRSNPLEVQPSPSLDHEPSQGQSDSRAKLSSLAGASSKTGCGTKRQRFEELLYRVRKSELARKLRGFQSEAEEEKAGVRHRGV